MKRILTTLTMAALFGCGVQEPAAETATAASPAKVQSQAAPAAETTTADPVAMNLRTLADLPTCDADREGVLAYVQSEKDFFICEAGVWTVLDVRGEKGDRGEQGEQGVAGASVTGATGATGAAGQDGTDGIDNHIASRFVCGPMAVSDANYIAASLQINIIMTVDVTTYGDVMAQVRFTQQNYAGQVLLAQNYPKNDPKAATAEVVQYMNWVGAATAPAYWTYKMNRAALTWSVEYNDPDMPLAANHLQWNGSGCTRTDY